MKSELIRTAIEAIAPASTACADAARRAVASAGVPLLERVAAAVAGAQHQPRVRWQRRAIVVVAGDHGCADPGVSLADGHPSIVALRAIADGSAALAALARTTATPIALVDAGLAERAHAPAAAVAIGRGPSHDLTREPAMTVVDAVLALEAGIALAMSLAEQHQPAGLDILAVGAIGLGADVASAALLAAATGVAPPPLADPLADAAALLGVAHTADSPLDQLAALGGADLAVLAGLMLGAASLDAVIALDSYATGAAAVVAAQLAPAIRGNLVATHRGAFTHAAICAHLGLEPWFEVGLGHGDGTGAAMTLALIEQVAALTRGG